MENTLIIRRPDRDDFLIIDPGARSPEIVTMLQKKGVTPAAILLTHGHVDHIAGNTFLRGQWPDLPIFIGAGDAPMLTDPIANLSALGEEPVTSPPADRLLVEGDRVYVMPGGPDGNSLAALDKRTGALVWKRSGMKTAAPRAMLGGINAFNFWTLTMAESCIRSTPGISVK